MTVDQARYEDSARWGRWANGGGSSLELMDAGSDNRLPSNWADSDESTKSEWTLIEHEGVLDLGFGNINELHALLLRAGECLIDDVEVLDQEDNNAVINSDFESGLSGWTIQGNHIHSSLEAASGIERSNALHIRASGGGDNGANRVEVNFKRAASLNPGQTATIRAKARWLKGSPDLLLRLHGNHLETLGNLKVPENLGTPGLANSRSAIARPSIMDITHFPIYPADGEEPLVTARIDSPGGELKVELIYLPLAGNNNVRIPMNDDGVGGDWMPGDGIYSGKLPAFNPAVILRFYIEATQDDSPELLSRFPEDAPDRTALIRYGPVSVEGSFPTYRLLMTQEVIREWSQRRKMSNQFLDMTLIYGNYRAIYNAGARYRGSAFIRPQYSGPTGSLCAYIMSTPGHEPLLGANEFNLDWLEQPTRDNTFQREKLSFWIADRLDLPFSYQRYINLYVNGRRRGRVYMDSQQPNGDYISSWFPEDDRGEIYKIDDWFEFNDSVAREFNIDATLQNYTTTNGEKKKARYRWNWEKKVNKGLDDDYSSLYELVDALNNFGNNYTERVESLVDVEQWMRVFAVRHIVADWDGYGYNRGKNMFTYKPENGRWKMLLWDMDFSLGGGSDGSSTSLFSVRDFVIRRMYDHPPFRRYYFQAMHDAVTGPLLADNFDQAADLNYRAFQENNITVTSPGATKRWVNFRRRYIQQQLDSVSAPFEIITNTGENLITDVNLITLEGTAPIEIRTIEINGISYPLTWNAVNRWSAEITLQGGRNRLKVVGYDSLGRPVDQALDEILIQFTGEKQNPENHIVINEIMYRPELPDAEFIELHNTSLSSFFDLSNIEIDGLGFTFPQGMNIGPNEFLILVRNPAVFAETYGASIPITGGYDGSLADEGETIRIIRRGEVPGEDQIWDQVTYQPSTPWPGFADGRGSSLQLRDPFEDNDRVGNWSAINPEQVERKEWKYVQVSGIATSSRIYLYIGSDRNTGGSILIDDLRLTYGKNEIEGPNLIRNGNFESPLEDSWTVSENHQATEIDSQNRFEGESALLLSATSNGFSKNTSVWQDTKPLVLGRPYTLSYYFLQSETTDRMTIRLSGGGLTSSPNTAASIRRLPRWTPGAPNNTDTDLDTFPNLWINEVQVNQVSTITDNLGEHDPWVELYNGDDSAFDLTGYFLSPNIETPEAWSFPAGTLVPPMGYLLIWTDGQPEQSEPGSIHTSFGIDSAEDEENVLILSRMEQGEFTLIDFVRYGSLAPESSLARLPDGNPVTLIETRTPSPGASNESVVPQVRVLINEWMADNQSTLQDLTDDLFDDWIELYNPDSMPADLSGFTLTDDLSIPDQFRIPLGTEVPANGFLLVWADNDEEVNESSDSLHANFRLSRNGELIALFSPDGRLVDQVQFGPQKPDVSLGRSPDGQDPPFVSFNDPSPNTSNAAKSEEPEIQLAITQVTVTAEGQIEIQWNGREGHRYAIQRCDDLQNSAWKTIIEVSVENSIPAYAMDHQAASMRERYYRVVLLE